MKEYFIKKREKGSVIIAALVAILILSVTSAAMLKRGFFEIKKAHNLSITQKTRITAYSAIEFAKADIGNRVKNENLENFTFLLDGSMDDLNEAGGKDHLVSYKSFDLNGFNIRLYLTNNLKERNEGLFLEDKDKRIEVRSYIFEKERNLYSIRSVFAMDESKQIKAVATYRAFK